MAERSHEQPQIQAVATTPDGRGFDVVRPQIVLTASGMTNERGAADYLGCAVRSLQRFRQEKRGPAYRVISGRVWYPLTDLDDYLLLCRVDPLAG